MLKVIMTYFEHVNAAMGRGISLRQIQALPLKAAIGRMKDVKDVEEIRTILGTIESSLTALEVEK